MAKKKKTLHLFVFSHVLIAFLCCVAVGAILTVLSEREISRAEENALRGKMRLALEDMAVQLDSIQGISAAIKTQACFRPAYLQGDNLNEAEMIKQFAALSAYTPLTDEYYLLYRERGTVYSAKTRFPLDSLAARLEMRFSPAVRTQMESARESGVLCVENGRALLLYPFQLPGIPGPEGSMALIAVVPLKQLEKRINMISTLETDKLSFSLAGMPLLSCAAPGQDTLIETLEDMELSFLRTAQSASIARFVQTGMRIILLVALFMCVLAIIAAFFNYAPIRRMLRLTGGDFADDEFAHLRETFLRMREQNMLSEKELEDNLNKLAKQQADFAQYLLMNVLSGEMNEQQMEQMRKNGIHFDFPHFRVLVVADELPFNPEECAAFAARGEDFVCYAVPLKAPYGMALLKNSKKEEQLHGDAFSPALQERLAAQGRSASIGRGCVCGALQDVPLSFAAAIEALSAAETPDIQRIRQETLLKKFRHSFKNENYSEAWTYVEKLLPDSRTAEKRETRYLQARLAAVLWQYADKAHLTESDIAAIGEAEDAPHICHALRALLTRLDDTQLRQPQTTEERVLSYIRRNFSDSQFNLDAVVQTSGQPEKQVRVIVQQATGMSFMEYVKMLKIEKAKQLLREEKMSVNEICQSTGYATTSYFIALFKKMTGYTPKQYQEISKGSGENK